MDPLPGIIADETPWNPKRMAEQAYYLTRAYYRAYQERRTGADLEGDIVLLTMGKVGSMTLLNSLCATTPEHRLRVDKAHCISPEGISYYNKIFENAYKDWNKYPKQTKMLISRRTVQAHLIRKGLRKGKQYKIVVLIRDPVATNISGFFHNHKWWPGKLQASCKENFSSDTEALKNQFLTCYPHDIPLSWFDMELSCFSDIDFFSAPFPTAKGYQIYSSDSADVLILRLENLGSCVGEAFQQFLGLENFCLLDRNRADDKWYDLAYKEFKNSVVLPSEYLDRMYDSKWYSHFYNEEERNHFRSRWLSTGQ